MAVWIKNKQDKDGITYYPECSNCGYHWIEEVINGKSDITDANYCPKCGNKMEGVKDYNEIHK